MQVFQMLYWLNLWSGLPNVVSPSDIVLTAWWPNLCYCLDCNHSRFSPSFISLPLFLSCSNPTPLIPNTLVFLLPALFPSPTPSYPRYWPKAGSQRPAPVRDLGQTQIDLPLDDDKWEARPSWFQHSLLLWGSHSWPGTLLRQPPTQALNWTSGSSADWFDLTCVPGHFQRVMQCDLWVRLW